MTTEQKTKLYDDKIKFEIIKYISKTCKKYGYVLTEIKVEKL